ncbi:MAG: dihydrofolate reductase family protein [Actinomycetota bacterium]|nr:dihydrofolate reductase family protein [Actinomycetota bacterium]
MCETTVFWETFTVADQSPLSRDFAELWRAADKIVYSKSLEAVSSARTRIEDEFDPRAIREIKAAQERDLTVGGSNLAAQALRAGLVDECQLFLTPVVAGGKRALPDNVHLHWN